MSADHSDNQDQSVSSASAPAEEITKKYTLRVSSFFGQGLGAVFHPLYCSKVLLQLGHEPLPLQRAKSYVLLGHDAYFLPNVFKYISHIKKENGFQALCTGVGTSLCYNFLALGASIKALDYLNKNFPDPTVPSEVLKTETAGQAYSRFVKKISKETASKAIGIVVARPLQVVVIRRIAQIIGGETIYVSTYGSLRTICEEEGFRGLFSKVQCLLRLMPQLVGEMMILWISSTLLFVFDRYWSVCCREGEGEHDEPDSISTAIQQATKSWKKLAHFAVPFVVNSLFYPFQLVSTMMVVNGTSLKVGQPPYMPIFLHWQDCWTFLANENNLKRGSKLFMRTYVGPIDYKDGKIFARTPKYSRTPNQNAIRKFVNDLQVQLQNRDFL